VTHASAVPARTATATAALVAADPAFAAIVARRDPCPLGVPRTDRTPLAALVHAVVAQQVSDAAATTINGRLVAACGGTVTAERLAGLAVTDLRGAGLSASKARTVAGVARAVLEGRLDLDLVGPGPDGDPAADAALVAQLLALWGVGRWTVEMLLLFQYGRLDVWPTGDLAVRSGWDLLHADADPVTPAALEVLGAPLRPHRSVAAWYCYEAVREERETRRGPNDR
jgi:DNA-3-methyladenine glycosylase II